MKSLYALNHPQVVRVFDANVGEPPYYLMREEDWNHLWGKTLDWLETYMKSR